jgi:hypothetical protein
MLSMSEHREIANSVNNMENNYNVLKSELDEFTKVAENLSKALETQQAYIRLIKAKMGEMDKSNAQLEANQESRLRNFLLMSKGKRLSIVTFVNEDPTYADGYFDEYERDPVIKIKNECEHELIITTLLDQAFNICRQVLGEPVTSMGNVKGSWIVR